MEQVHISWEKKINYPLEVKQQMLKKKWEQQRDVQSLFQHFFKVGTGYISGVFFFPPGT